LEKGAHLSVTRTTAVKDGEVKGKRQEVDQERNNDKTDNAGDDMRTKSCNRHLGVTKLSPKVLDSVETDESSNEKTDKLDTADTANAETSHEKPEEPLGVKAVVALVVELGPAEHSGYSTAEKHGIKQDESADGGVRVLAKDHESHKPDSRTLKLELAGSEIGQRNAENTESRVEDTHDGVVDFLGVLFARLEFEGSVVASKDSGETNKHLAERRVHIEVVLMLDIVGTELAEVSFIPGDNVADTNLV
jgi:hypothetical protein